MPIPRYEGGNTPFQKVQPVGYQAQAQMFNSLEDRLSQWQNMAFNVAKEQYTEMGRNQAIQDMTSGEPLKVEKGYSFYAKAYNDVAISAYNSQIESDLKVKAEEYASQSKYEPDKFNEMFSNYAKTTVGSIEEPQFKAIAMQKAQQLQGVYYGNLLKETYKNQRENDLKAIDAGIKDLSMEYESAFSNDDFETAPESLAKITALMESKVKAGAMSADMIPHEIKRIMTNGIKTKVLTTHSNLTADGKIGYKQQFLQSAEFKNMSLEDRTEVVKKLNEQTESMHKAVVDDFKNNQDLVTAVSKMNEEKFLNSMYSGGKVKESDLLDALRENKLTAEAYQGLMQISDNLASGAQYDDNVTVMNFTRRAGHIPDAEIIYSTRITAKTKIELLNKNRSSREQRDANDALREAINGYKSQYGKTPHQMLNEELDVQFPARNPNEKVQSERDKWEIYQDVTNQVAQGKISVMDIPNEGRKLAEVKKDKRKKEREAKKVQQEAKKVDELYQEKANSVWGKLKSQFGEPYTREDALKELKEKEDKYGKLK